MAPLGFFDPLGFTKVGDEAGFRKLRAAELKHGRVAMMASVGLLGQHFVKLPGFEKAPSGLAVLGTAEGVVGIWALLLPIGFLELARSWSLARTRSSSWVSERLPRSRIPSRVFPLS